VTRVVDCTPLPLNIDAGAHSVAVLLNHPEPLGTISHQISIHSLPYSTNLQIPASSSRMSLRHAEHSTSSLPLSALSRSPHSSARIEPRPRRTGKLLGHTACLILSLSLLPLSLATLLLHRRGGRFFFSVVIRSFILQVLQVLFPQQSLFQDLSFQSGELVGLRLVAEDWDRGLAVLIVPWYGGTIGEFIVPGACGTFDDLADPAVDSLVGFVRELVAGHFAL